MTTKQKPVAEQTVLITGGTGSFGKTMALHLLDQGYGEIRIFSRFTLVISGTVPA